MRFRTEHSRDASCNARDRVIASCPVCSRPSTYIRSWQATDLKSATSDSHDAHIYSVIRIL